MSTTKSTTAQNTMFGQSLSASFAFMGFNLMVPKDMVSAAEKLGDQELGERMQNDPETLRKVRKLANDCAWYGRLHLSDEVREELGITVETGPSVRIPTFNKKESSRILKFKLTEYVSVEIRRAAAQAKRDDRAQGVSDRKALRLQAREEKAAAKLLKQEASEVEQEASE